MTKEQKALKTFRQYGFGSDLASRLVNSGYSITKLKAIKKTDLAGFFTGEEIEEILTKSKRQPIPPEVYKKLLDDCDGRCCICRDID